MREIFNILFSYEDKDIERFSNLHQCNFKKDILAKHSVLDNLEGIKHLGKFMQHILKNKGKTNVLLLESVFEKNAT